MPRLATLAIGALLLGATATAALAGRIRTCFTDYKFSAEMKKEFLGDDRFLPVS